MQVALHRRNQEIEMYTHTSGVDHEQGSLSLIWGGSGVLPREKIDFRDGWRTILSHFYGRKFVFFQEIFIRNVHVSFTLRTCVACVMGVTPLHYIVPLYHGRFSVHLAISFYSNNKDSEHKLFNFSSS